MKALVERILTAVVRAVTVPVTLKIRTGTDSAHRNAPRIAAIAQASGVAALSIHGRTRADFFRGDAEYDTIRHTRAALDIPLIANGDIDTPQKARAVLDFTGAEGVMLGRAAQGAPWIFRDVNAFLSNQFATPLLRTFKTEIILAHLESLYEFYGEYTGVRMARKHLGWYCRQHSEVDRAAADVDGSGRFDFAVCGGEARVRALVTARSGVTGMIGGLAAA